MSLDVQPGLVVAQVQGSRSTPYMVTVATIPLSEDQWAAVHEAITTKVTFTAQLLAGQVPPELERVFDEAGVPLLPARWNQVQASCSCPDWENPCKHIAAVLYVFADRLDDDPWQLLLWRGRTRDDVLAHLEDAGVQRPDVAPWWPLVPGAPLPVDDHHRHEWAGDDPAAVLARLGPLGIDAGTRPATERFIEAYVAIVAEA